MDINSDIGISEKTIALALTQTLEQQFGEATRASMILFNTDQKHLMHGSLSLLEDRNQ